jgi:hypothetical protein
MRSGLSYIAVALQRSTLAVVAGLLGCSFDSESSGATANTIGADASSSGDTSGRPPMPTKGPGEGGSIDSGGDSSGAPMSGATLRFEGFDEHDFGNVGPGAGDGVVLSVINVGDEPATAITPSGIEAPFRFQGTDYPGAGATCGDALDAGADCTVALLFAPASYGQWDGELTLTYAGGGGPAKVALHGTSAGQSANLLVNGDAESGGNPPMGWSNVNGSWQTRDDGAPPHNWQFFIFGGPMNGNGIARLRQRVPLQAFAEVIDNGELDYTFRGWARSLELGNDPHQIVLVFLDGNGDTIDMADLGTREQAVWMVYDDANQVPSSARSVAVDLLCHKHSGNACSALFDDLLLTVTFVAG